MNKHYTDEENAQVVIALLKAHGIRKAVVSPGTTNAPITGSIQNDPFFEVFSAVDERSAAYMACGISAESNEPVVISCTGATASRNYLSGMTEAWYRKLPIIALTSTPSLTEVGHLLPQCIDRSTIPKDVAKVSVTLPVIKDKNDLWDCETKVNMALLEARRGGGGPVHINIATSYKKTFTTKNLPDIRVIKRITPADDLPPIPAGSKIAVALGSHKRFSQKETEALEGFVSTFQAVVLCDHTSSYRGAGRILSALAAAHNVAARSEFQALRPDLIIHIGEISGDYETFGFLIASKAPVWRVSEDGQIRDRFRTLRYIFEMREQDFFTQYARYESREKGSYLTSWKQYTDSLACGIPVLPFSNTWIAQEMAGLMPRNATVHFGILNCLRNWNFFDVDANVTVASNVGGFGIDGCVSSLIGASLTNSERLYFAVVGDLAFFYDMNSLGNRHVGNNVRILLVNNGGGGEFKIRTHLCSQFGEDADDYLAAAGHFGNKSPVLVKNYVEALGFEYCSASTKDQFKALINRFVRTDACEKPMVLECFTSFEDESTALDLVQRINTAESGGLLAARIGKRILPSGVVSVLKRALR